MDEKKSTLTHTHKVISKQHDNPNKKKLMAKGRRNLV